MWQFWYNPEHFHWETPLPKKQWDWVVLSSNFSPITWSILFNIQHLTREENHESWHCKSCHWHSFHPAPSASLCKLCNTLHNSGGGARNSIPTVPFTHYFFFLKRRKIQRASVVQRKTKQWVTRNVLYIMFFRYLCPINMYRANDECIEKKKIEIYVTSIFLAHNCYQKQIRKFHF